MLIMWKNDVIIQGEILAYCFGKMHSE